MHVLRELERRKLPYEEISLSAYPDRLSDLEALGEVPSVPQVFFNTRYVGGVDKTKMELRRWDRSGRYNTPAARYEAEIANGFDPANERLALPSQDQEAKVISHASLSVLSPTTVVLPDGTMTSVRDITEKLKNSISCIEVRRGGTLYKNVFTGAMATDVFMSSLGISEVDAIKFGNSLMDVKVIQPLFKLSNSKKFVNDKSSHYRLQCFQVPSVLNSYCFWEGRPTASPLKLSRDLVHLLDDIETSAVDRSGLLDYDKAREHSLFPLFEESVCELQKITLADLSDNDKTAFALNIYLVMLRYAFFKLGIPLSESDRLHFLANVKFQVGGNTYSFDEWSNVAKADQRAIYALCTGAANGSTHSLPFASFSSDNLERELAIAAKVYFGDNKHLSVNRKKGTIEMSNLFHLKKSEFGGEDEEVLENVLKHLDGKKKTDLSALVTTKSYKKISYLEPTLGRHTNNSFWYEKESLEVDKKGLRGLFKRFRPAKMAKNERARLAALHGLNLLDTLEEERYDRIVSVATKSTQFVVTILLTICPFCWNVYKTLMAKTYFDVPLVFVSLIDQNRQWFKSTQWHTNACARVPETGRDVSFCGHTILNHPGEMLVINDATKDDRFAENPFVTGGLFVRFYAGYPLSVPSVDGIGTQNSKLHYWRGMMSCVSTAPALSIKDGHYTFFLVLALLFLQQLDPFALLTSSLAN